MTDKIIKAEKYIVIQGFMVNDLHLKGNQLIIYAIIYGFSQAENQRFTGSLQYLADWTNSTKQGTVKSLKDLVSKGLIAKEDKIINGVKFCEYYATKFNRGMQLSCMGGMQLSSPNNINIYNLEDNIVKEEIYKEEKTKIIKEIVDYLNKKLGTKYRYNSKETVNHINARLEENFTLEDFKTVIDKKYDEWHGTDMEKFLRPETLFGNKFEGYLNQKVKVEQPKQEKEEEVKLNFSEFTI